MTSHTETLNRILSRMAPAFADGNEWTFQLHFDNLTATIRATLGGDKWASDGTYLHSEYRINSLTIKGES